MLLILLFFLVLNNFVLGTSTLPPNDARIILADENADYHKDVVVDGDDVGNIERELVSDGLIELAFPTPAAASIHSKFSRSSNNWPSILLLPLEVRQ